MHACPALASYMCSLYLGSNHARPPVPLLGRRRPAKLVVMGKFVMPVGFNIQSDYDLEIMFYKLDEEDIRGTIHSPFWQTQQALLCSHSRSAWKPGLSDHSPSFLASTALESSADRSVRDPNFVTALSNREHLRPSPAVPVRSLPSFRLVVYENFLPSWYVLFLECHGPKLRELQLSSDFMGRFSIFDTCESLQSLALRVPFELHVYATDFFCTVGHTQFAKLLIRYPCIVKPTKEEEDAWNALFQALDVNSFPAQREIQVPRCVWPLNKWVHPVSFSDRVRCEVSKSP
ncbi:hypothetical protein B0H10DRAFT_2022915 [Mycena sp. CBHHK59/15]|nr:hypothetical protein B0H10DRAFT_2022915 [Mycena sp. CBHHK59/15]